MNALDFKRIGGRIKERRQSLGLTQEYIANALDVNASHTSNIEGGRARPSLTALVQIANILECSIDFFIDGEYVFHTGIMKNSSLDSLILEKIKYFDTDRKEKVLKMIDLL